MVLILEQQNNIISFIHSFINLLINSFIYLLIHLFIHSFKVPYVYRHMDNILLQHVKNNRHAMRQCLNHNSSLWNFNASGHTT